MKALNKSPHYLVRNPHSFCFRVNVPKDLQCIVGKKELRYTLRTGYVGVARVKAQLIAAQVRQIFLCLRKGGRRVADLTDDKIQELVQQYLKEYIQGLESRYYEEDPRATIQDRYDFHQYLSELDFIKTDIVQYLGIGEYSTVEGIAIRILKENGIEGIEKDSAEYVKLCRGLLRAQLQGIDMEKQQMSSGLADAPDSSLEEQPPPLLAAPGSAKGPLISEVIELYAKEAESNWTPKTKDETLASLRLFVEVVGDVPITSITRQRVGEFKQTLLKLPPNIKKNPNYRKKSISEIVKMDVDDPPFDEWLNDEYWSELVAGYMRLDKRARWKARHCVSELFPEHFLKCLRSFVEDRLRTSVFVEEVSLPLRFKNPKTGKEQLPYLFISNPGNTIYFEPDLLDEDEELFFELCGHLNLNTDKPIEGIKNAQSQLRKYMRHLRN